MATITTYLSNKVDKQTNKSEILFRFVGAHSGCTFRIKSGIFIDGSKYWNEAKTEKATDRSGNEYLKTTAAAGLKTPKQVRIGDNQKELKAITDQVTDLQKYITDKFNAADKNVVDKTFFETIVDKFHHPDKYQVKPIKDKTLLEWINEFIETAPKRKKPKTNKYIGEGIIKHYKVTAGYIRRFAASKGKTDFQFSEIDESFYNDFYEYLTTTTEKPNEIETARSKSSDKKYLCQNTIAGHIKTLKTFLKAAPKNLFLQINDLDKFKTNWEDVDNVYLNETELQQINDVDLANAPYLDRVRDQFLLLCWTGCRYSDLNKLTGENIKNGYFEFRQQKTNNEVVIPIHPIVEKIMRKYNGEMPKVISEQRFNEWIKNVAKLAGIDGISTRTRTIGGKRNPDKKPKYELIGSHTGRRSFCTNMYNRGVPHLSIMAVSGHKTETSFMKYIKTGVKEKAKILANSWKNFYNQK